MGIDEPTVLINLLALNFFLGGLVDGFVTRQLLETSRIGITLKYIKFIPNIFLIISNIFRQFSEKLMNHRKIRENNFKFNSQISFEF